MIGWIIHAYWSQKTSQSGKNIRNTPHPTPPHHTTPHHTTPCVPPFQFWPLFNVTCDLLLNRHTAAGNLIFKSMNQISLTFENKKFLTQLFLWWLQVSVQQPLLICLSWHFATCLNILRCNFLLVQGFQLVVVFPGLRKERLRLTKYFNTL